MIQGIVFDLDGTIIDSEPIRMEAEIMIFKEEGLNLTHNDCRNTKGLSKYEIVNYWYDKLENPKKELALLTQDLNQIIIKNIKEKVELKPGVIEALEFCKRNHLSVGIASSSSMAHIKAALDKFELNRYFKLVYSGDFERFGKPHPGIYISACKKLKIDPPSSIAIEDSFNGLLSAKSARMKAVAVLDENEINNTKFDFADAKIKSLTNFDDQIIQQITSLL